MNDNEVIELFTKQTLVMIDSTIQKAYSFAEFFIADNNFLMEPSVRVFHQNIRNFSVDYNLRTACEKQQLHLQHRYRNNQSATCQHLELYNQECILTHSSVIGQSAFPRPAYFRKDLAGTNQITFEEFLYPTNIPTYGIITHLPYKTDGRCAMVSLGIPDSEMGYWSNSICLTSLEDNKLRVATSIDEEYNDFAIAMRSTQYYQENK